jgi:Tfp pilus assembly protein PilP
MQATKVVNLRENQLGRRKVSQTIISLFVVILMLVGCSSSDPVQEDLLNYWNNEILTLDAEETKILDAYASVTGDNYKNDEDVLKVLEEITPKYKTLSEKIESIRPETKEVKELHELYISATNTQYNAFLQLTSAIEKEDVNLVVEANEKIDTANKALRDFDSKLAELQVKHNIE